MCVCVCPVLPSKKIVPIREYTRDEQISACYWYGGYCTTAFTSAQIAPKPRLLIKDIKSSIQDVQKISLIAPFSLANQPNIAPPWSLSFNGDPLRTSKRRVGDDFLQRPKWPSV